MKMLLTLGLIVLAVTPVQANSVNLRCTADNPKAQSISLKIDYDTSRVTVFMDWQPNKARIGPDAAADGSMRAQVTDALIVWTISVWEREYEKYMLDRYAGVLRVDSYINNQFDGGYSLRCKVAQPSERKF